MADPNTVRILSLDGGGVRGYLSLKWLQRFIQQWGITPNEIWKYFDVITGTSIGGIQALGYAYGKSPDELEPFFTNEAKRLFTIRTAAEAALFQCNAGTDSNRPSLAQKIIILLGDAVYNRDAFYLPYCPYTASPPGTSNYGVNILHDTLVNQFGTDTLQELKTKSLIPAYEVDTTTYVLFSNYIDPLFTNPTAKLVDVAMSTAAAPAYLPEYSFNNHTYIDGGVYQNNPAELALTLAKAAKPTATRSCVLSIGTGIGEMGFYSPPTELLSGTESVISTIFSLFDVATTGGQESVDFNLKMRSQRTLEQLYYYRFQPMLDQATQNTELDNSDVSFLAYMENLANSSFDADIDNINNFIGHLIA